MIDEKKLFLNSIDTNQKEKEFVEYLWNSGYRFSGRVNCLISPTDEVCTYFEFDFGEFVGSDEKNIYSNSRVTHQISNYDDIELSKLTKHSNVRYVDICAGAGNTRYELVIIDGVLKTIRDFSKDDVVIITTPKCSKMYTKDEWTLFAEPRFRTAIIPETLENENGEKSIVQLHEAAEEMFFGSDRKGKRKFK